MTNPFAGVWWAESLRNFYKTHGENPPIEVMQNFIGSILARDHYEIEGKIDAILARDESQSILSPIRISDKRFMKIKPMAFYRSNEPMPNERPIYMAHISFEQIHDDVLTLSQIKLSAIHTLKPQK